MAKRMLIDATHPEETRVAVVDGMRLEEFDFENLTKRQIKGNIYLAKVTRVEPSLQAAFVEYGGNRQGFLSFAEIHPDYYNIPLADQQALIEAQRYDWRQEEHFPEEIEPEVTESGAVESGAVEPSETGEETVGAHDVAEAGDDSETQETGEVAEQGASTRKPRAETLGDDSDEIRRRRRDILQRYKIQDVIKRRQILLIQVSKEERGGKGAALTTYLSLPGRYCVLMPNSPQGGGVSRKIANPADRKKMRDLLDSLDLPEGMSVILRTAGLERNKTEIKRDLDYLLRLWESIRDLTFQSTAPALVYEEGDLIKRSIRDGYHSEIDQILVAGEEGYRDARDFMNMLMPSHTQKVQPYQDPTAIPLFHRFQVEQQIDAIHSQTVQLRSGGYIVIGQTEALVAIDVNSGRSTKERNIEETALKTNLEAADEIARQLRLRDMGGLIVIDFIDMEEPRHDSAVERRLKEAMKMDRARIQIGRISSFGLLELSRQRMRPSLLESAYETCPHCQGTGMIRTVENTALSILRHVEDEGIRRRASEIIVHVPTNIALYILNQKRDSLAEIELRYSLRTLIHADDGLIGGDFRLERLRPADPSLPAPNLAPPPIPRFIIEDEREEHEHAHGHSHAQSHGGHSEASDGEERQDGPRRRRRRRGGRNRDGREPRDANGQDHLQGETLDAGIDDGDADADALGNSDSAAPVSAQDSEEQDNSRRRRGRRGGRRFREKRENRGGNGENTDASASRPETEFSDDAADIGLDAPIETLVVETEIALPLELSDVADVAEVPETTAEAMIEKPKRGRKKAVAEDVAAEVPAKPVKKAAAPRGRKKTVAAEVVDAESGVAETVQDAPAESPADSPAESVVVQMVETPVAVAAAVPELPAEPAKKGWWKRG